MPKPYLLHLSTRLSSPERLQRFAAARADRASRLEMASRPMPPAEAQDWLSDPVLGSDPEVLSCMASPSAGRLLNREVALVLPAGPVVAEILRRILVVTPNQTPNGASFQAAGTIFQKHGTSLAPWLTPADFALYESYPNYPTSAVLYAALVARAVTPTPPLGKRVGFLLEQTAEMSHAAAARLCRNDSTVASQASAGTVEEFKSMLVSGVPKSPRDAMIVALELDGVNLGNGRPGGPTRINRDLLAKALRQAIESLSTEQRAEALRFAERIADLAGAETVEKMVEDLRARWLYVITLCRQFPQLLALPAPGVFEESVCEQFLLAPPQANAILEPATVASLSALAAECLVCANDYSMVRVLEVLEYAREHPDEHPGIDTPSLEMSEDMLLLLSRSATSSVRTAAFLMTGRMNAPPEEAPEASAPTNAYPR